MARGQGRFSNDKQKQTFYDVFFVRDGGCCGAAAAGRRCACCCVVHGLHCTVTASQLRASPTLAGIQDIKLCLAGKLTLVERHGLLIECNTRITFKAETLTPLHVW